MYDYAKLLHLIAGIVWMGGMTFMLFALRPAAMASMEAQPRAVLMGQVWQRFYVWVLVSVVVSVWGGLGRPSRVRSNCQRAKSSSVLVTFAL